MMLTIPFYFFFAEASWSSHLEVEAAIQFFEVIDNVFFVVLYLEKLLIVSFFYRTELICLV